jgi:hypothetical protein
LETSPYVDPKEPDPVTKAPASKVKVSVYLPPEIARKLRRERADTGRPASETVESLLRAHYSRKTASGTQPVAM